MTRPFRFLHAADIHLDSPLKGLAHYQGAPTSIVQHATRSALQRMVDIALHQEVDFVVIAGDLYDGSWPDQSTGLYFAEQMSRLRVKSIPVFIIRGNHDAASRVTDRLRLPENVTLLPTGKVSRCEHPLLDDLGVTIHGYSYQTAAVMESVMDQFPQASTGQFTIGLLHTAVEGNAQHQRYAPCSVSELVSKGYQYWALGHVHQRQWLSQDPPIVFPGNLQGRHIKETDPKGCYVIDVDATGKCVPTFFATDVVRWFYGEVDLPGEDFARTIGSLHDWLRNWLDRLDAKVTEERDGNGMLVVHQPDALALRVKLRIERTMEPELKRKTHSLITDLRSFLTDISQGRVWLEGVKYECRKSELPLQEDSGAVGLMRSISENADHDHELLNRCRNVIAELCNKLPPEAIDTLDGLRTDDGKLARKIQQLPGLITSMENNE